MTDMQTSANIELASACYARTPIEGNHSLCELPMCGKLAIRGDSDNNKLVAALGKALSMDVPVVANTHTVSGPQHLFWMGPDEWLLHCPLDQAETTMASLQQQLADFHHSVVEVSDYYTVLQLSGPESEQLIRRGCPLDLHLDVFPEGSMAQTRFGHASVLLHRNENSLTWDIQVRWTYAEYVWDYLESAMKAL